MRSGIVSVVGLVACVVGCSSESSKSGDAAGGTSGAGGAVGNLTGNVTVELFADQSYATVSAQIFDGPKPLPNPSVGPLVVSQQQAGCTLWVPKIVSCSPACGTSSVCTDNNVCTPNPAPKDVGTLHVTGLGGMDLAITSTSPGSYSGPTLQDSQYPPCSEGADIGAQSDQFSITGKCIAPFVLTGPDPIPVMSGQSAAFTWTPPSKSGISRVQISLEISHHGGYKGEIDCDVPDTGSFDIPASLVTALVNLGRAGYPSVFVTRVAEAAAPTQSRVKLTMLSQVTRDVDTGVISCGQGTSTCPTGMACDGGTKTCK
jgi:hypothetical protein